jgi:hypothetical protein
MTIATVPGDPKGCPPSLHIFWYTHFSSFNLMHKYVSTKVSNQVSVQFLEQESEYNKYL